MHVGADEAGKGPVLGPMIAAAVRSPTEAIPEDVADSKRLSSDRRELLDRQLREHPDVEVAVAAVEPVRIDSLETDMNGLTVAAQARALSAVVDDGDVAIVDAGDVSESRFARRVREGVEDRGVGIQVTAEHGADDRHPIVAAASVVAKVERDRRMELIDEEYAPRVTDEGIDTIGSGYPSDPATRKFLRAYVREHGDVPDCARRSWATCADVLAAAEQSSLGEF
ncbi:Ribonuclease HII [Halalkaliarchaeum sp. AArc-CO]|uniref:ribonuclease HII n=1 Tax=unclassified Halalkaliarchaeum TaxID=2678344 RepID=UPI00217EA5CF|nr:MULTISPECIES: ribonuclease HII [unclassified Halalkaliarchaeum]MDR5671749.1 ribonuclease HII [Halalkaliarchaeum sp. AArc-GB]UWG51246.1 Ribonuclease HII [Halalkaliarchaeum sp. AArc-CO]